jgi:hypothetical protein
MLTAVKAAVAVCAYQSGVIRGLARRQG